MKLFRSLLLGVRNMRSSFGTLDADIFKRKSNVFLGEKQSSTQPDLIEQNFNIVLRNFKSHWRRNFPSFS